MTFTGHWYQAKERPKHSCIALLLDVKYFQNIAKSNLVNLTPRRNGNIISQRNLAHLKAQNIVFITKTNSNVLTSVASYSASDNFFCFQWIVVVVLLGFNKYDFYTDLYLVSYLKKNYEDLFWSINYLSLW